MDEKRRIHPCVRLYDLFKSNYDLNRHETGNFI